MNRSYLNLNQVRLLCRFDHRGGFAYSAPLLHDGDTPLEPLKSKLVLFEDGIPLRRAHEHHDIIAGTGRGAYSHWERYVFFSASDNTDPNRNGRSYSFAIDRSSQHQPRVDGRTLLIAPFYSQGGLSWGVVVAEEGDSGAENLSTLRVYEDEAPLGPSHADHVSIEEHGAGRFSHWNKYLYFSTSDNSDPNTNGRLYTYELDDTDSR